MGRGFGRNCGKVWFLSANDAVSKATHLHQNVELGLPTTTTRRILEDLAAHGLVVRTSQGQGKPDLWQRADWEVAEAAEEAEETAEAD